MKESEVIKYALDRIGGKWKAMLVWELRYGPKRFSDLKSDVQDITQKMLTQSLVEMQEDGLLVRKSFPQIPPRVEYTLTSLGESLIPISAAFFEWGALHQGLDATIVKNHPLKSETSISEPTVSGVEIELNKINPIDKNESIEVEQNQKDIDIESLSMKDNNSNEPDIQIENDPWFFAPVPQKPAVKKKSVKKSGGDDEPQVQQLGLF
jgi:DNA-binding HxlR family transcriptional regulator